MSATILSDDLRKIKTKKALYDAMLSLLKKYSFGKITIKGLCEEALIGRATFYAHFIDKYDLLEHWVSELFPDFDINDSYNKIEDIINHPMQNNMLILKNLLYDADYKTFEVLFGFILSTINLTVENNDPESYSKNVVLSNFYAGGMLSYLLWQIENNFPADVPVMNKYLYQAVHEFAERTV